VDKELQTTKISPTSRFILTT